MTENPYEKFINNNEENQNNTSGNYVEPSVQPPMSEPEPAFSQVIPEQFSSFSEMPAQPVAPSVPVQESAQPVETNAYDSASQQNTAFDNEPEYSIENENVDYIPQVNQQPQNIYSGRDRFYNENPSHRFSSDFDEFKPQQGRMYSNVQEYPVREKKKKEKKPISRGVLVFFLILCILTSTAAGCIAGVVVGKNMNNASSDKTETDGININKSDGASASYASSTSAMTTTEIVEKAADSVVEITTESVETNAFYQQYISSGAGSGVIISDDGYIVTNYHVIKGASHITVTLRDQKTEFTDVEVVGTYAAGDIALLKVKGENLKKAVFGDSSKLKVGDYSVAIGNPLGQLGGTVTDGIISALDREVTVENETMNLLQTNSEISPGNSGGGLFNGNGELIGIVNAKSSAESAEGIGFAIPINDVQDVLPDLKKYGYVKGQIDLGLSLADITSTASRYMYGVNETGVYVTGVVSGSNASKAGFRYGDIITAINGSNVSSTSDIKAKLKELKVGDEVEFTVNRNGRTGNLKFTLEEQTSDSSASSNNGSNYDEDWDMFY